MTATSRLILTSFVILALILYALKREAVAGIAILLALLSPLLSKLPKADIDIQLQRSNQTMHKVTVENIGDAKAKDIRYKYRGRMTMPNDSMPLSLRPKEKIEFGVGLSFDTGVVIDVEVSWKSEFAITRNKKNIRREAIG
jgi:hypothetical protein